MSHVEISPRSLKTGCDMAWQRVAWRTEDAWVHYKFLADAEHPLNIMPLTDQAATASNPSPPPSIN